MEENQKREYEALLFELMLALKERAVIILSVVVVVSALVWGVCTWIITPRYEASVNMIINTRTDFTGNVTNDTIFSAQNLVDTYAIIIKSNTVLNKVIEELDLEMSFEELYSQVSVDDINNTQVMKIAVENEDARLAGRIVTLITEIAPPIVVDAVEAGACKVVSQVVVGDAPIFPETRKCVVLSGLVAFFCVVAAIVLKELLNDYVTDDEDIQRKLGISVLGVIPDVEEHWQCGSRDGK